MNTFAIHTDMNVLASNGLIVGLHFSIYFKWCEEIQSCGLRPNVTGTTQQNRVQHSLLDIHKYSMSGCIVISNETPNYPKT